MNFFFDRNMPNQFVRFLTIYEEDSNHVIRHHDDDKRFHPTTTDIEWMEALSSDGTDWIVISQDSRILKNKAERAVLQEVGLSFFFLTGAWRNMPFPEKKEKFMRVWPRIVEQSEKLKTPTIFKIAGGSSLKIDNHGLVRDM